MNHIESSKLRVLKKGAKAQHRSHDWGDAHDRLCKAERLRTNSYMTLTLCGEP